MAGVLTKGKIQIDTQRGVCMCVRIEAESKEIQQKPRNIKDCLNQKSGKAWGAHSLQEGTILPLEARLLASRIWKESISGDSAAQSKGLV